MTFCWRFRVWLRGFDSVHFWAKTLPLMPRGWHGYGRGWHWRELPAWTGNYSVLQILSKMILTRRNNGEIRTDKKGNLLLGLWTSSNPDISNFILLSHNWHLLHNLFLSKVLFVLSYLFGLSFVLSSFFFFVLCVCVFYCNLFTDRNTPRRTVTFPFLLFFLICGIAIWSHSTI